MLRSWWRRNRITIEDGRWSRTWRRLQRWPVTVAEAPLRALCEGFLRSKTLHAAGGFHWNDDRRLLLAAVACRPLVALGAAALQGWRDVIVYPGQFRVRREHFDASTGVASEWDDELAGEAWEHGPIVLSWADVVADLRSPQAGFEVAVHEMAHKLDLTDGAMNGTPALPSAAARRTWVDAFQPAFEHLLGQIEGGEEAAIDPYAGESEDEFFAVASEYHFTAPDLLQAAYPAVAEQLRRFYAGELQAT